MYLFISRYMDFTPKMRVTPDDISLNRKYPFSRSPNQPWRVTACFIPNADTICVPGEDTCWFTEKTYNPKCSFSGAADVFLDNLLPTLSRVFNATKRCVWDANSVDAVGCDITFGTTPGPHSLEYHVDTIAAMSQPEIAYAPWDFLNPFSWEVWLVLAVVVFVATPIAMAIVEYDPGESLVKNFLKFLPDSIHAHTGADILSNDTPEKNTSYVLSVFVSIFAFILICLYAANLTTYVLYKDDYHVRNKDIVVDRSLGVTILGAKPIDFYDIALGISDGFTRTTVVVSENRILRALKGCADVIVPLDIPVGKWVSVSAAMFPHVKRFAEAYDIVAKPLVGKLCSDAQIPMTLSGIYGLFLLVFVPAGLILASTCLKYGYNRYFKKLPVSGSLSEPKRVTIPSP